MRIVLLQKHFINVNKFMSNSQCDTLPPTSEYNSSISKDGSDMKNY